MVHRLQTREDGAYPSHMQTPRSTLSGLAVGHNLDTPGSTLLQPLVVARRPGSSGNKQVQLAPPQLVTTTCIIGLIGIVSSNDEGLVVSAQGKGLPRLESLRAFSLIEVFSCTCSHGFKPPGLTAVASSIRAACNSMLLVAGPVGSAQRV